ncbi:UNKNOWN [Stylonychia lemnae]|uniref:Uncharacterized protein n=1 Tax=Stylonychia lemnae TaxID=5949 RepID=A0A078AIM0_STYLE|nr:UNKNOWN [Stylonychia lemnae]|eukprot:CDW81781.1 UNKNOWN [Stylonychia lemnae]
MKSALTVTAIVGLSTLTNAQRYPEEEFFRMQDKSNVSHLLRNNNAKHQAKLLSDADELNVEFKLPRIPKEAISEGYDAIKDIFDLGKILYDANTQQAQVQLNVEQQNLITSFDRERLLKIANGEIRPQVEQVEYKYLPQMEQYLKYKGIIPSVQKSMEISDSEKAYYANQRQSVQASISSQSDFIKSFDDDQWLKQIKKRVIMPRVEATQLSLPERNMIFDLMPTSEFEQYKKNVIANINKQKVQSTIPEGNLLYQFDKERLRKIANGEIRPEVQNPSPYMNERYTVDQTGFKNIMKHPKAQGEQNLMVQLMSPETDEQVDAMLNKWLLNSKRNQNKIQKHKIAPHVESYNNFDREQPRYSRRQ